MQVSIDPFVFTTLYHVVHSANLGLSHTHSLCTLVHHRHVQAPVDMYEYRYLHAFIRALCPYMHMRFALLA